MEIKLGSVIPARLQLGDGAAGLFPLVRAFDANNTQIAGSPANLTLVSNGLYASNALIMPATPFVNLQYEVYTDSGHTVPSTIYMFGQDIVTLENSSSSTGNLVEIIGYVVQSVGPINNAPIPDQQILNIVQGDDFGIQVRFKNKTNFQPYYLDNLTSVSAQFVNTDGTILSVSGAAQANDDSVALFQLNAAQTALLAIGASQSFQVTVVQSSGTTIVPMNNSLNITPHF